MTKEEVKRRMQEHNESITRYYEGELAEALGAKDGKISLDKWFKAQELIKAQGFYDKGIKIVRECQAAGFDVKMNMQDNSLVGYGIRR